MEGGTCTPEPPAPALGLSPVALAILWMGAAALNPEEQDPRPTPQKALSSSRGCGWRGEAGSLSCSHRVAAGQWMPGFCTHRVALGEMPSDLSFLICKWC